MLKRAKRSKQPPEAVSVNGRRLGQLGDPDLYNFAESCLMNAGFHLSKAREGYTYMAHIEQAEQQAEWAMEGLRVLRERGRLDVQGGLR